ncbi:MAG: hypothetical protein HOP19_12070 [Acidobacteria bacterium]|nr:hypothetical protein [Acidobacteriota bacterium]
MRSYEVLVERQNGHFRALIPTLPNVVAEGATRDEAVVNAKELAQRYLLNVESAIIQLADPVFRSEGLSKVEDLLAVAGLFSGDEAAMQQHIEDIYAERRRQRDEAVLELNVLEVAEAK